MVINDGVLLKVDSDDVYEYDGHIKVPEGVYKIAGNAFNYLKGVKKVSLPNSVVSIVEEAFKYCSDLEEISIPDNVEYIANNTFYGCKNLIDIKFPKELKSIGNNAFYNCDKLREIKLPSKLRNIGTSAFENCFRLISVEMPNSVETIGRNCFFCDGNLINVKLSNKIKEIPYQSFSGCMSLEKINIPNSVISIDSYAFYQCCNLKNINLSTNLKTLNDAVFQSCTSLKYLNMPDSVTKFGNNTFSDCRKLSGIKLSNSLTKITKSSFCNCINLSSIEIPDSVKTIECDAFYNCRYLENVKLPSSLLEIQSSAFQNCISLKDLEVPNSIKKIGVEAFSNCKQLTYLFIPDSIEIFQNSDIKEYYFSKEKNGFSISINPENPDAITFKDLNINASFLSKFWEHKDILLREQKNPYIAYFYNSFINNLPKDKIDDFISSHNFKFFKQFDLDKVSSQDELNNFCKFIYNLGGVNKPIIDEKGKIIDYAQKVSGFILQKLQQNYLDFSTISDLSNKMEVQGFKKDFSDFFIKSYNEILLEDLANEGFFARCYNEFEKVQKTNTNNRGSQRQLKPTMQKFIDYFDEFKFIGITEETKPIADTISPYFSAQETFDYASEIDAERRKKGTPNNILGFHLSEKPFAKIDEYADKIIGQEKQILGNIAETATNEFSYDWLEKNDPENFILGKLCSCCAHLEGVGEGIMHASIVHPNVQNLVIRNGNNEIVAKSTLFINPEEGYGVFNNVEVDDIFDELNDTESLDKIYEKYIYGVDAFAKKYNDLHPDKPLRIISVGMNLNDLGESIELFNKETKPLLKAIDYGEFCKNGEGYNGDSEEEQYTIWEKE